MKVNFNDTVMKWHKFFLDMKPGDQIEIAVKGNRDPVLFIDMCKDFIDLGNIDFEFDKDYKFFRRINSF